MVILMNSFLWGGCGSGERVQIFWTTYNETIKTHIKTIGMDIYAVMDRVRKGCHNEKYQPTKD